MGTTNFFNPFGSSDSGGGGTSTFSATLTVTTAANANVTASMTGRSVTGTANNSGIATLTITDPGTYTVQATKDGTSSDTDTASVMTHQSTVTAECTFITLSVTVPNGSEYTITDGTTTMSGTSTGAAAVWYLPNTGTWTASCTDGEQSTSQEVAVSDYTEYSVTLEYAHVYGVIWDKTQPSTVLTRTDDAASFANPDPYVNDGNHPGSSPFDNRMPWRGMVRETFSDDNVMVKIPKFWYKIENSASSLKIQISTAAKDGFSVSPAHRARNANESDRDYVYIGRYKCGETSRKSVSGERPAYGYYRSSARTACAAVGLGYWQQDFALFWTVRMLYIVEFANWDSNNVIGLGNYNWSAYNGNTDQMPYHTGTMGNSRASAGTGIQYRNIEAIYGFGEEFIDGIIAFSNGPVIFDDPATFSDSYYGGTQISYTIPNANGFISDLANVSGDHDWVLYPSSVSGSDSTYIPDYSAYDTEGVICVYTGGNGKYSGLFYLVRNRTNVHGSSVHFRLMYLPTQTA